MGLRSRNSTREASVKAVLVSVLVIGSLSLSGCAIHSSYPENRKETQGTPVNTRNSAPEIRVIANGIQLPCVGLKSDTQAGSTDIS